MQELRSDGSERFEPLEGALHHVERALPPLAPEARYPPALVEWHDAWFDFDQQDADDCRTDYLVRTVGFLVSEGPRFVSIAQEVLPEGEGFRAITHIPLPIVERIVRLRASGEDTLG